MNRNLLFKSLFLTSIIFIMGFSTIEAMPVVSKAPNKKEVKQEKQKLSLMQRLALKIMQKRLKKMVNKVLDGHCNHIHLMNKDVMYVSIISIDRVDKIVNGNLCDTNTDTIIKTKIRIPFHDICRIEYSHKKPDYFSCTKPPPQKETRTLIMRPTSTKLDGLALLALIFAFILPPLGFFFSIFSISKINNSNRDVRGKGIALFALIVSLLIMGAIGVIYGLGLY